ncbi:hypothetical protein RFI_15102, partial [Reticulomyxa filosa]
DADLILLSLLLHEPNVFLMRDEQISPHTKKLMSLFSIPFQMLHFNTLREYLLKDEWSPEALGYKHLTYNPERVLDDWVFLSYFVGNDFVPNLPFFYMRFALCIFVVVVVVVVVIIGI